MQALESFISTQGTACLCGDLRARIRGFNCTITLGPYQRHRDTLPAVVFTISLDRSVSTTLKRFEP